MSQYNARKLTFLDFIWEYKISLGIYIIAISFLTFVVLYMFGGVPDELKVIDTTNASSVSQSASSAYPTLGERFASSTTTTTNELGELPVRITISKIDVDAIVSDPTASDNTTLNNDLLKGAVRYPGSGTLGHGNMFLFGHSTGIKIVNNQAYKTFNNLKNLNIGDVIKVQSGTSVYTYTVTSVSLVDSDAALVDLSSTKNMLTLSTCDVFGQKQQRFVVEADYSGKAPL